MKYTNSIKFKFILNLCLSVFFVIISIVIAYIISVSEIKNIMTNDLNTIANTLAKQTKYIAKNDLEAFKNKDFKNTIYNLKIGKSGYVYFIDKEGTMVIHHKKEGKNYAGHDYIDYIRSHENGTYEYISATTGQNKIVAFRYIKEWGVWMIPGINKADYFINIKNKFIFYFTFILASLIIILSSINYILGKNIFSAILELKTVATDLAFGEGNLTKQIDIKRNDEISEASEQFNAFISKVGHTISIAKESSKENTSVSSELSSTTIAIGEDIQTTSHMILETNKMSQSVKKEIKKFLEKSISSQEAIEEAANVLEEANNNMKNMSDKIQSNTATEIELANQITQLNTDTDQVKGVLSIIADIADQTNLLALNAAIEAARAGEHGRGFAVVADEVRNLAERTQNSLTEINTTINIIIQATSKITEQMNINAKNMENLDSLSINTSKNITQSSNLMYKVQNTSQNMVKEYDKTYLEINKIVRRVEKINFNILGNAESIEEINTAASYLNTLTEKLNNVLDKFQTRC